MKIDNFTLQTCFTQKNYQKNDKYSFSKDVEFAEEVQRLDIVIGRLETRHCIDEVFSSLETQFNALTEKGVTLVFEIA